MSTNTEIHGEIIPSRELTAKEAEVFMSVINHNDMKFSVGNNPETGVIRVHSENMVDYGFLPLEVARADRYKHKNLDFAEFISYLITRLGLGDVTWDGGFDLVTESDPFPKIQQIDVSDSIVSRKVAKLVFPEQGEVIRH